MTSTSGTFNTVSSPGSTVGIQAEQVHNSSVYQILPDASPEQKYELGIRCLDDGIPSRARELIEDAIAHGFSGCEARFHLVLAMLDKRSLRDLSQQERDDLANTTAAVHRFPNGEWKRGLEAICELLRALRRVDGDPGPALDKILALDPPQRDKIIRHLDLVLTGGTKDRFWAETHTTAQENRFKGGRGDRVWAYFEPDPAEARARRPLYAQATTVDTLAACAWSTLGIAALAYLGWIVLDTASLATILPVLVVISAGVVAGRTSLEWRYRTQRRLEKDADHLGPRTTPTAANREFSSAVDSAFRHYFDKYGPTDEGRQTWQAGTRGIRSTLATEVAEIYSESSIGVGNVRWLIRHLARRTRRKWDEDTLLDHRRRYSVRTSVKLWFSLSLTTLAISLASLVHSAVDQSLLPASSATLALLGAVPPAVRRWYAVISERRRTIEDFGDYWDELRTRQEEHDRWVSKLESTRPSEKELEAWLNCDKTVLLNSALKHYKLAWRDIIAHAFLQTPASRHTRARVTGGPWRYSRYDISLFLITQDGVREVSVELNFERVSTSGETRNNFRFDAVSSVHVTETSRASYTLELTLLNGPARNILVTLPGTGSFTTGENEDSLSRINLDSAGFTHTLHILEGIAAEGKAWIERDTEHDHGSPPGLKVAAGL
ncbi:hypothetical protein [Actinoalloteichus caeruleus]|uniref:hypothetical protein n=1 Tax=Actinoalloteichus cyanogriseus TaxID=2893586 RepID=UPI0004AA1B60|nr:hypothetical protein [Actinoalloteichus caeruleus]